MPLALIEFVSYAESVPRTLEEIGAGELLAGQQAVLIKPNLVNDSPFPVTTHPKCCEAVVHYIRKHSKADIIIAEGCGASGCETDEVFAALGYDELSKRLDVPLADLNTAPAVTVKVKGGRVHEEFILPEIAFERFIISLPVLKRHSFSTITGSLKNMMGFLPPKHYGNTFGGWKKAAFHPTLDDSIRDLNQCVTAGLTVLDASVGLAEFHLGGRKCSPPVNKILAATDPCEADRTAAGLLDYDWRHIPHLVS